MSSIIFQCSPLYHTEFDFLRLFIHLRPGKLSSNTLPFYPLKEHNLDNHCSACFVSPCRIYFICQKSGNRFLLIFFSHLLRILFSLKLWNIKHRSTCSFHRKLAFISVEFSLREISSLMLCMCTRSTTLSFALANDAKKRAQ